MIDIPKIPEDKLRYRPYLVKLRFKDELDDFISQWLEMYPGYLSRYDIILRCHSLAIELEREENEDRGRRNAEVYKKALESEHSK